jgi:hypothetical protein
VRSDFINIVSDTQSCLNIKTLPRQLSDFSFLMETKHFGYF